MFGSGRRTAAEDAYRLVAGIASLLEAYAMREGVHSLLDPQCRVVLLDDGKIALCFGDDLLRGAVASATTADKKDLIALASMMDGVSQADQATKQALFNSMAPMTFDMVAKTIFARLQSGGHDPVIPMKTPKARDYAAELEALRSAYDDGDLDSLEFYARCAPVVRDRVLADAVQHGFDVAHARAAMQYDDGDLDTNEYMASVRALIVGEIALYISQATGDAKRG